jgi:hypothetical protein
MTEIGKYKQIINDMQEKNVVNTEMLPKRHETAAP